MFSPIIQVNKQDVLQAIKSGDPVERLLFIEKYCLHKGKTQQDTTKFILALRMNPFAFQVAFSYAIKEMGREFVVTMLLDTHNQILTAY